MCSAYRDMTLCTCVHGTAAPASHILDYYRDNRAFDHMLLQTRLNWFVCIGLQHHGPYTSSVSLSARFPVSFCGQKIPLRTILPLRTLLEILSQGCGAQPHGVQSVPVAAANAIPPYMM